MLPVFTSQISWIELIIIIHPSNIRHDHFESNPLGHVCARVVVVHVTPPLEISTRISTSRELSRLLGMLNFVTTREARYDAGDAWFPLAVLNFITKCTGSSHRHSAQHESSGPEHSEDSPDHLLQFPTHVSSGRRRPEDVARDLDGPVTCQHPVLAVLARTRQQTRRGRRVLREYRRRQPTWSSGALAWGHARGCRPKENAPESP